MAALSKTEVVTFPGNVDSQAVYAAEQAVIACCVREPDRLNHVSLEPKHFTAGPNERLWETLLALQAEGEPIDDVTVMERLEEAGYVDEIHYLFDLLGNCLDSNFEHKANLVYRRSQKKTFWLQVERACHDRDETEIVRIGEAIQSRLAEGSRRAVQASVETAYQSMVDEWAASRHRVKMTWGLSDIDQYLKPMEPTRLHVVVARPGVGKTAFALQTALRNAEAGIKVGIISLEQSMEELTARMLCNLSQCPIEWVKGEDTPPAPEARRIDEAKRRLIGLPIMINDATPMTIAQLKGWARSLVHRYGCRLLIVDYIQKIGGGHAKERHMEVAQVVMGLKDIARAHKIPVLALAQAKRDAEGRIPLMSDIRDSGFIEQEADQILALHREFDKETKEVSNECQALVLKNRHGISNICIRTLFRADLFRFETREFRYAD